MYLYITVLIIDNELNLHRLESNSGIKFEAFNASNGQEALLWLQTGHLPDLIIVNVAVSNLSGVKFLQIVRSNKFFKDIPIIFLSTKGQNINRLNGLKRGADDYLVKPFTYKELLMRITTVLHMKEINNEELTNRILA